MNTKNEMNKEVNIEEIEEITRTKEIYEPQERFDDRLINNSQFRC